MGFCDKEFEMVVRSRNDKPALWPYSLYGYGIIITFILMMIFPETPNESLFQWISHTINAATQSLIWPVYWLLIKPTIDSLTYVSFNPAWYVKTLAFLAQIVIFCLVWKLIVPRLRLAVWKHRHGRVVGEMLFNYHFHGVKPGDK